ncbi:hypothetical protein FRC09_009308 [Ceratobasidium sp. 395]|nr:hypothetical protein FRC09_009308 [Ceratobasidium sp. 395]
MLEAFARSQTSAHDPNNISAALSEAASQRILDVAKVPNSRENLFGTFITKDGEEKTTGLWDEGSYGGVPVEFLSRILWRGRREILQICSEVTTTGWSFVILLLKEHLRWALESRECYWPFEWAGIQMLAYRQILIAPSMLEISYLTDICIAGETNRRESAEPLFADAMQDNEDIDVLMTMVIRRMKPSPTVPRLPAKSATPILGWFINYLSFPRKTQLVPSFLEATYLWIWAELVDSATSHPSENEKLYKYASHILYFTSEVFKFHGAPRDRATFTNILVQVEFVNLIGRLLLTPLEIGGFFPSAFTAHISGAKDFLEDWKQLWGYIRRFLGAYDSAAKTSSNQSLVDSYPDWLKIWSCLETHLQAYDQIRSTWGKEWVINCVKLWSDLASAFGYETRPPQEQLRHWLEPTFEAHRRTCSEIWEDV